MTEVEITPAAGPISQAETSTAKTAIPSAKKNAVLSFTSADNPLRRRRKMKESFIEGLLFLSAFSSVLVTIGIVGILVGESIPFFKTVSVVDFLTDTQWTPLFDNPHYGILPLLSGTLMSTVIALFVAIPLGTVSAAFISDYLPSRAREIVKPLLELLSAVPTVVYGYFALLLVTPMLAWCFVHLVFPVQMAFVETLNFLFGFTGLVVAPPTMIELEGSNILSAGIVIGIMIIPYVSSLSEDAMRSVPNDLREGSYAMGATRFQTVFGVVIPSAFSGITSAYILGISRAVGETMVVAIAAGMQPNLTMNPTEPAATITAFIVQVSLGDLPHGTIGYQSIYVAGLTLLMLTLTFNVIGFWLRKKYREAY